MKTMRRDIDSKNRPVAGRGRLAFQLAAVLFAAMFALCIGCTVSNEPEPGATGEPLATGYGTAGTSLPSTSGEPEPSDAHIHEERNGLGTFIVVEPTPQGEILPVITPRLDGR
ncbi:MAG: hypothetical protein Q4C04_03355 [Clostridia bacterium]|nr:hypothetical protein [Clostridia bacterium]